MVARGPALVALSFDDGWERARAKLEAHSGELRFTGEVSPAITGALEAYLAGQVGAIEAIEVDPGGTDFQQRVWRELRTIPAGRTMSYGELAAALGDPNATRAVGTANGANPIAIVIPCHRVLAADGSLHGYGGGLRRKAWLLEHEGALSPLFRRSGIELHVEPMGDRTDRES